MDLLDSRDVGDGKWIDFVDGQQNQILRVAAAGVVRTEVVPSSS